jgi:peptide methionine sulfoxide reductase msrA/msrB
MINSLNMKRVYLILGALLLTITINAQKMSDSNTYKRAVFASGCYWGTEYYLQQADGVIETTVGYAGGNVASPSYRQVTTGTTGHAESVEVVYNPAITDYETLARLFFETHDPTQVNRQGPDVGTQYRSAIFYANDEQKAIAEKLVKILEEKGLKIATEITQLEEFFPESKDYHHDYYKKTGGTPYCHAYKARF